MWLRLATGLLAIPLVLSGCVGPSRTDADFRRKTAESAQAMISVVETALLTADVAARDKATAPYVSVQLSEAEVDAGSIVTAYGSVQPPSGSADRLREKALEVLETAHGHLHDLRIAGFRGELKELPDIAAPLTRIVDRLERFEKLAPT